MNTIYVDSDSSNYITSQIPDTGLRDWKVNTQIATLKLASLLTHPVCKTREYFYTLFILDEVTKGTVDKIKRAASLVLGMTLGVCLTPFTAPIGIALRTLVAAIQPKPYIFYKNSHTLGKQLPNDGKITLVSHNQCYMQAGYTITDGQVTPPCYKERMNTNIEKMKQLNPDIICLYEVADIYDAEYLSSKLKEYPFIISVAGVRGMGVSSMMYVASKYEIVKDSIEFTPFEKGTELTGRAQFSEKGILSFDIKNPGQEKPFASIISTHLQHSEIPQIPTADEIAPRKLQMEKLAKKVNEKIGKNLSVIVTGDLNMPESELNDFLRGRNVDWLKRDPNVVGKETWGGDEWCAKLMGKQPSEPQVLDYTLAGGNITSITTEIHGTNYDSSKCKREALSDHSLLFTTIEVRGTSH